MDVCFSGRVIHVPCPFSMENDHDNFTVALSFVQLRSFNLKFFFFTITGSELLQNNWLRNFTISWQMDVGMRTVKMRIAHQVPNLFWKIRNVMLLHYKLCSYLKIKLDYVMFNQAKFPELLNRYSQAPVLVEHHHVNRLLHPQLHLYRLILIMRHVWSQVHQVLPCQQVLFFYPCINIYLWLI